MKSSRFKISISVESYEKTDENYRNCYVAKNCIVSKLSEILILIFDSTNWRLRWRMSQNFTSPSFLLVEKKVVKERFGRTGYVGPGWARLGRFIVLKYSASRKMVTQIYFIFLKDLEQLVGPRGDPSIYDYNLNYSWCEFNYFRRYDKNKYPINEI